MSQSRKHRGLRTQKVVAGWFAAHGWPFAESTGAGRSGVDITGVPGLRIEVKARRGFTPMAWLRQVRCEAPTWGHGVPFVVFRPDGMGEASVGEWGCLVRLDDFTTLLHEAGYGSPERGLDDGEHEHSGPPQQPAPEGNADDELEPVKRRGARTVSHVSEDTSR